MTDQEKGRLTLRAIEIFLSVVDSGGLGEGARRVGAAASTVSQQIVNLESALGVTLIDRGTRPFVLTAAGRLFHARALNIIDEIGRARSELSAIDLSAVQELTLAVLEDLEGDVLPELLVRLSKAFPNSNFVVQSGYSHSNLAALESRAVDLILTGSNEALPDWIEQHPIVREPLLLLTANGLIKDPTNPLPDLENAPMVRFNRSQLMARQVEAHLRRVRFSAPLRFEVETNRAMVALVARSGGWALATPLGLQSSGQPEDMIEVSPLPFPAQSRILSICARRNVMGSLPGAVAAVLREVVADESIAPALRRMPWLGDDLRVL